MPSRFVNRVYEVSKADIPHNYGNTPTYFIKTDNGEELLNDFLKRNNWIIKKFLFDERLNRGTVIIEGTINEI